MSLYYAVDVLPFFHLRMYYVWLQIETASPLSPAISNDQFFPAFCTVTASFLRALPSNNWVDLGSL